MPGVHLLDHVGQPGALVEGEQRQSGGEVPALHGSYNR